MKRMAKPYSGLLAEPIELHAPFELSSQNIALIARVFQISVEEAKSHAHELLIRDVDEILNRRRALFDHYGVDCNAPEAERTLALSLAARHEAAILFADERVDFGALCACFETNDPAELVRKLALKHVPGFQIKVTEVSQGRLGSVKLAVVFFYVFAAMEHLRLRGEKISCRRVAKIMLDEKQLRQVVPLKAARHLHAILRQTSNKDRTTQRDLKARTEYLRKAISSASNAVSALKSGQADNLQTQLLSDVWPILLILPHLETGQNDACLQLTD